MKFVPYHFKRVCPGVSGIAAMLVATALLGCGESAAKKADSQVVAKVNGEEITVSQLGAALSSAPPMLGKTPEEIKREVLDGLVVQKLAAQQAVAKKLDRTPAVMQAVEFSKNTILARAYMDPLVAGLAKPTSADVHKYYVEHPELFSERRVYKLRELEVPAQPGLAETIRNLVKEKSMEGVEAALKEKNITPSVKTGVQPAEQLPLELLARLSKLKDGQMLVIEMSKTVSVLQVVESKSVPVDEKSASVFIENFLGNRQTKETVEREIKSLKTAAKIEYFGDFNSKGGVMPVAEKMTEKAAQPDPGKGIAGIN
ncbi:MAG TPA: EpsD family peptidyl-prolyl cis-trans isomerase [Gallionella sp.]|nr:EpsD family peptidyl-prolyl cis-trans isomerase [Gallionella sp.]